MRDVYPYHTDNMDNMHVTVYNGDGTFTDIQIGTKEAYNWTLVQKS